MYFRLTAQPPNVQRKLQHPDLENSSKLSYRFPNQDPEFLKERFRSLKRKHQETTTTRTTTSGNDIKKKSEPAENVTSPNIKTECAEATNSQGTLNACKKSESNSENSSKSSAVVATFDSNRNFVVVSKESFVAKTFVQKEKESLSKSFLNRFENIRKEGKLPFCVAKIKCLTKPLSALKLSRYYKMCVENFFLVN